MRAGGCAGVTVSVMVLARVTGRDATGAWCARREVESMRITGESVRTVSRYARQLSNNYVAEVELGMDTGGGARILDGNSQVVWQGKPREAAAYYLGQVDMFASERGIILADYPAEVQEIWSEVLADAGVVPSAAIAQWYAMGRSDAKSRTESYCPEIRGAGRP
jgi:hypothetical protein